MQVCPALAHPPQTAARAAAGTSASSSTSSASLPPSSSTTGVSVSAQAAMILRPVGADPVKASLSTPARQSAAPVSPKPVTTWNTGCSGTASRNASARKTPTAGVYSLGLNTTALPAASAYAIAPIGVTTG